VATTTKTALGWLRSVHARIVAATPQADRLYTDADFRTTTAVVLGTEQYGLSDAWLNQADLQVRIPMLGQSDSLNVASAAALLLYEAVRQRGRGAAGSREARGRPCPAAGPGSDQPPSSSVHPGANTR